MLTLPSCSFLAGLASQAGTWSLEGGTWSLEGGMPRSGAGAREGRCLVSGWSGAWLFPAPCLHHPAGEAEEPGLWRGALRGRARDGHGKASGCTCQQGNARAADNPTLKPSREVASEIIGLLNAVLINFSFSIFCVKLQIFCIFPLEKIFAKGKKKF